jgi:hypothetical protein
MREEVTGQAYPRSATARIAIAGVAMHGEKKWMKGLRAWPSFQVALASMKEKFRWLVMPAVRVILKALLLSNSERRKPKQKPNMCKKLDGANIC